MADIIIKLITYAIIFGAVSLVIKKLGEHSIKEQEKCEKELNNLKQSGNISSTLSSFIMRPSKTFKVLMLICTIAFLALSIFGFVVGIESNFYFVGYFFGVPFIIGLVCTIKYSCDKHIISNGEITQKNFLEKVKTIQFNEIDHIEVKPDAYNIEKVVSIYKIGEAKPTIKMTSTESNFALFEELAYQNGWI